MALYTCMHASTAAADLPDESMHVVPKSHLLPPASMCALLSAHLADVRCMLAVFGRKASRDSGRGRKL